MATLIDLISIVCQKSLHSERIVFQSVDDMKHAIIVAFWEQPISDELAEVLFCELQKIKSRLAKRESRELSRFSRSANLDSRPDIESHSVRVFCLELEAIGIIPSNELESEIMLAESGLHPEFATFTEFAASGKHCSRSEAYKRRESLYRRLSEEMQTECA